MKKTGKNAKLSASEASINVRVVDELLNFTGSFNIENGETKRMTVSANPSSVYEDVCI